MKRDDINKVLIIGSGPIVIGQACEFNYSGTQACKALREQGYKIVLVNSNLATIMTDPVMADATYIEPLDVERLSQIIEKERPDALLPNLGGQTGLNMAMELNKAGVLDNDFSGVPLTSFGSGVPRALSFSCSFYFANAHSYTSFRNCFAGATYPNAFLPKTFSANTKTFAA